MEVREVELPEQRSRSRYAEALELLRTTNKAVELKCDSDYDAKLAQNSIRNQAGFPVSTTREGATVLIWRRQP
ncbi:MAG TPA: hypothetical protein VLA89_17290 [Gemmatimonadales bacterium]|nr:hypothetical protein [Gemmatimonadales bacterium]